MNQLKQQRKVHFLLWILLFSLRMAVLQMQKFRRQDTYFQDREVPATLRICCSGSIKESDQNQENHLLIKKLKKYIQQFYLRKVMQLLLSFQKNNTSIALNKKAILVWRWICYRNILSFALTFLITPFIMKAERQRADWKSGSYF